MKIIHTGHKLWDYFLKDIEEKDIIRYQSPKNFFIRRAAYLFNRTGVGLPFTKRVYKLKHTINEPVLVLDCYSISDLTAIRAIVPRKYPLYLWWWNPLEATIKPTAVPRLVKEAKEMGYHIFTFDQADASKYNIGYKNQFGFHIDKKSENQTDLYFCGNSKGRIQELENIKKICNIHNISYKFIIPDIDGCTINYEENLNNAIQAKCLLEIIQNRQTGLTLRSIEALLNSKKLITNNQLIKNMDFYNPENIFIWGIDDASSITEFINSPYVEINKRIKDKYTFQYWLNSWKQR